jgi:hypothetical protein
MIETTLTKQTHVSYQLLLGTAKIESNNIKEGEMLRK